ncbi:glycine/sarcosine/betaine reductase complex component C subunit beta [Brachyspira pilosicoli B2904]|uniref:Glycine/sarcosine/betaine reductase complex component C subunit beta n=1 Tax=Brachyspira pilosicoli B2904 TaxID=1133568 RepID=J9URT6_BRAPL|nr:glycine/sarcosine/betaine reductase complex component C subunit beta [Brachyspira pilosicoli]AFR70019.1 glycine/sarcosine/betaine reductase complex component C subunit beta [Brachyspira pilosicoli B2904]
MSFAVLKAAAYSLVHAPDMVINNGTTQTVEKEVNPNSDYLKNIKKHLRPFEDVVNYAPNQTYIGNLHPEELKKLASQVSEEVKKAGGSWIGVPCKGDRNGKFGEIFAEDEFIFMMKISDTFELVYLEAEFEKKMRDAYVAVESKYKSEEEIKKDLAQVKCETKIEEIERLIKEEHAEGLYFNEKLVGCVKRAHDVDINLSAHVIFENLAVKASGVMALKELIRKKNVDPSSIDLVIECSEEACGDMNQRGGGNFAKSVAEIAGIPNATGFDIRGFCAAPSHALVTAASLVKAGSYKNVVIVAGGATAKLGMNGKSHITKNLPIIEDILGAFAVLISENDGVHPIIRTDVLGRHTVATGSAPQAVMNSLVVNPLEKANLKVTDIDKYTVEMQNPDVTKPAGAGDVPEANYKMIAAIGVKKGDIERSQLAEFVEKHGMSGWAPTQGHIPSGVPYLGYAIEDIMAGKINRIMLIGKGSLFLGRMTNLFDGISVIIEKNNGDKGTGEGVSKEEVNKLIANAMRDFAKSMLGE